MEQKIVTIFGAGGFIGRMAVRAFAQAGYTIRAVGRNARKLYFLKVYGDPGQIATMGLDFDNASALDTVLRGAACAVYLPGLLFGSEAAMRRVHADLPARAARAAAAAGVGRFVHVSALACERGHSVYARTKFDGERAVLAAFPQASVLRPSLVFGPGDGFFCRFAALARMLPALPLAGGGKTLFQPVHAADLAAAIVAAATLPARGPHNPEGRLYDIGGSTVYSLRALIDLILDHTGLHRPVVPLPFAAAEILGSVCSLFPGTPLLTRDQAVALQTDNTCTPGMPGLDALGVRPTPLCAVLPSLLERFRGEIPFVQQTVGKRALSNP